MYLGFLDDQQENIWIRNTVKDGLKRSQGQILLECFSNNLLKLTRKKIWIPRCERTIAWEKEQKIDIKMKKKKMIQDQKNPNPEKLRKRNISAYIKEKIEIPKLKDKVKEVVWDWIKGGKR